MKDLYRVLKISTTATQTEIKEAYRKMALALHPDRHAGCEKKSAEFKTATDAYETLSDKTKRQTYDQLHIPRTPHYDFSANTSPSSNYRKVYAPTPPPGFKTFDARTHFDMHYGDGTMREAIERIRRRQRREQGLEEEGGEEVEYHSVLGKGFRFGGGKGNGSGVGGKSNGGSGGGGGGAGAGRSSKLGRNGKSTAYRRRHDKKPNPGNPNSNDDIEIEYDYEEAYMNLQSCTTKADRVVITKEIIKERMHARRKERVTRRAASEANDKGTRNW